MILYKFVLVYFVLYVLVFGTLDLEGNSGGLIATNAKVSAGNEVEHGDLWRHEKKNNFIPRSSLNQIQYYINIKQFAIYNFPYYGGGVKDSPDQSHFISKINVGKIRIRHRTTLK